MKRKLTINSLAFGNLRARKKQYSLMVVGIVLAMVFSSGMLFFLSCANTSIKEMRRCNYGCQNAILINAQRFDLAAAKQNEEIEDYGLAHIIGYVHAEERDYTASAAWLDSDAMELSYATPIQGRLPEKPGEVAVEAVTLMSLNLDNSEIGDKITLELQTPNGEGTLPDAVTKSYTLVGILNNKRSNISANAGNPAETHYSGIPTILVCSAELIEAGGKESLTAYINFKSNVKNSVALLVDVLKISEPDFNLNDLIYVYNANTGGFFSSIAGNAEGAVQEKAILAIVLAGVLMLASCMGIINAFQTNLLERKKQIGLLRAVGTTRRQIISIFGREALLISLFAAPVSLLISYFSVRFIVGLMGEQFVFIPSWGVLIGCTIFGISGVMLAALIPLAKASKASPMQAIRNVDFSRKMKNKKIRSKLSFSAPSLLAKRSLLFGRGKQVGVSVILILTIVFSCFGFSYMQRLNDSSYSDTYDYRINKSGGVVYSDYINYEITKKGSTENDKAKILSSPYVAEAVGMKTCFINIVVDEYTDYMTCLDFSAGGRFNTPFDEPAEQVIKNLGTSETDEYKLMKEQLGYSQEVFSSDLMAIDAGEIKKLDEYVLEGKIDIDKLNSGEEVIVCAPPEVGITIITDKKTGTISQFSCDSTSSKYFNSENCVKTAENDYFHAGETLNLSLVTCDAPEYDYENPFPNTCVKTDKAVKIGAVISSDVYSSNNFFGTNSELAIFTTLDGLLAYPYETVYQELKIRLKNDCTPEIDDEMTALLNNLVAGRQSVHIYSDFAHAQSQREQYHATLIMMVSIIILFFAACASIVNNSLTAQIRESKQEIGTLRAVGASARELTRSYILQLLSMFGIGCGTGFALYVIIFAVGKIICELRGTEMLSFNVLPAATICLLLFALCGINLRVQIRKQMKYSIVENIREL